ncbi:MAG TPA: SRPBCC family protein [Mycobacteriales bacterium]|nr:SRPBCC family protein [Mycobacteriales bacterium]
MADEATSTITIAAARPEIMAVIADFDRYPEWAGFIKRIEVKETGADGRGTVVHWVLDAGVVKAEYDLGYTWHGDDLVEWRVLSGSLKQNDGSYELRDLGDGTTEVTYRLVVDMGIPMLGMFKRKAEKVIMDTALKELKKRVESGPAEA